MFTIFAELSLQSPRYHLHSRTASWVVHGPMGAELRMSTLRHQYGVRRDRRLVFDLCKLYCNKDSVCCRVGQINFV